LQSRYYDPEVGRFISIDDVSYLDPESINGLNLYAYCNNNPVMNVDPTGTSWWTNFWNSTAGKIVGTILVITAIIALSILTAGAGAAVTAALGSGFWAAVAGGAVGGAISGAIFGAGFSIVSQGILGGYTNIDWSKVGVDTLIGIGSGALMGAAFAAGGRALGLLGKTKWAQRLVDFNKPKSYMFGSKSGNFTFVRSAKFRIEASIQHGIHMHYQTIVNDVIKIGASVPRTILINTIWNTLVGITSSSIRQWG